MSEDRPRHEKSDVDAWRVAAYGAGILILVFLIGHLVPLGVFKVMSVVTGGAVSTPERNQELPPPPQLQSRPAEDFRQFRETEEKLLHTYGWVDRLNGVVRIPVDHAMDLIVARGVPRRPNEAPLPSAAEKKPPVKKP